MALGGPEACGRSTRGRLPGSSYLDLPPKCSQYGILWPTNKRRRGLPSSRDIETTPLRFCKWFEVG